MNRNISEIEKKNIKLITIATDRKGPLKRLAEKEKYQFPIISDKDGQMSKEFNVFGEPIDFSTIRSKLAIPTTYLIDSNGKITWRYLGNKEDRPSIELILDAIDNIL